MCRERVAKNLKCSRNQQPFVERLIGTVRREFLDQVLFWNARDLERKLEVFRDYYNDQRVHSSLDGDTPAQISGEAIVKHADLQHYRRRRHCRGLYELSITA